MLLAMAWDGGCTSPRLADGPLATEIPASTGVAVDTLLLRDTLRNRDVPVAIYWPVTVDTALHAVLLSHGYNANLPGTYLRFSSLCTSLAEEGRLVVSIQHELPNDETLAMKGDLRESRRPNWERGVENILFVRKVLEQLYPAMDLSVVDLVGHSNGGDISMLFTELHPTLVGTVVSLDNLRMPLPRTRRPRIRSIRAADTRADAAVLPDAEDQRDLDIIIETLPDVGHSDMNDRGSEAQRSRLNSAVSRMLR